MHFYSVSEITIANTFILYLRPFLTDLPIPGPALTPPSCIATPVEDQAKGEEWNQWQGSPRRPFSPGSSHRATPHLAARPASHWSSLSACSQDGEWG